MNRFAVQLPLFVQPPAQGRESEDRHGMANETHEPMGEVFTRRWVVEWMLDLADFRSEQPLHERRLVEPSCGSGAFIGPVVDRLVSSARHHDVPLDALGDALWACDLHEPSVAASRTEAARKLRTAGTDDALAEALAEKWIHRADFLLTDDVPSADWIVGNPPYVRHDEIPTELAKAYRAQWSTMRGRCDLYVPFYERSLLQLKDEGVLAFICADRWMRNQYGRELRRLVHELFDVETVVRLHHVDAFEEEVDAYPAITIIRRGEQRDGRLVEAEPSFSRGDVQPVNEVLRHAPRRARTDRASVAVAEGWFGPGPWPEGSPEQVEAIARWEASLPPLENDADRTRVGIGVATGADEVFISRGAPPDVEEDRLLPMVTSKHIRSGSLEWTPTWLVNPWTPDGLIDLTRYPRMSEYLLSSADKLRRRHIAKKNLNSWHRTIDRVHAWLTKEPKVLLTDMKDRMTPVVDYGEYYPHHNLYWVTSDAWDVEVLAGLLLSDQAESFIRAYCVKMRGGTLRMQAQYLRMIRVPSSSMLSANAEEALRAAYLSGDREMATQAAREFYG